MAYNTSLYICIIISNQSCIVIYLFPIFQDYNKYYLQRSLFNYVIIFLWKNVSKWRCLDKRKALFFSKIIFYLWKGHAFQNLWSNEYSVLFIQRYFLFYFFKLINLFLFSYNCLHFLPFPPPHPSQSHLRPPRKALFKASVHIAKLPFRKIYPSLHFQCVWDCAFLYFSLY